MMMKNEVRIGRAPLGMSALYIALSFVKNQTRAADFLHHEVSTVAGES
jgi:hypothetical protein